MSKFLDRMKKKPLAARCKDYCSSRGRGPQNIDAAQKKIVAEGIAKVIFLIRDPEQINVPGATVVDPATDERQRHMLRSLLNFVLAMASNVEEACKQMNDAIHFATMMVKMGDADGSAIHRKH